MAASSSPFYPCPIGPLSDLDAPRPWQPRKHEHEQDVRILRGGEHEGQGPNFYPLLQPFVKFCFTSLQDSSPSGLLIFPARTCHLFSGARKVNAKYTKLMSEVFRETFCWLPLCHVINGESARVRCPPAWYCFSSTIPRLVSSDSLYSG